MKGIYPTGRTKDGLKGYEVKISVRLAKGVYHQDKETVYGYEQAVMRRAEMLLSSKSNPAPRQKQKTLQSLFDEFITAKQSELSAISVNNYKSRFYCSILPYLSDVRLDCLTVSRLQDWKNVLNATPLSYRTKTAAYKFLHSLLNYAYCLDYLPSNPLDRLGGFKRAKDLIDKQYGVYTVEDFGRFIAAAKQAVSEWEQRNNDLSERYYCLFFSIAFNTGLRCGELLALKWSDINGNMLSVSRSVSCEEEKSPKTRSSVRTISMPPSLVRALEEHKRLQSRLDGFSEDWRVCGGERCLCSRTARNRNFKYAAAAGLPSIRIHDFRHSHITYLFEIGMNPKEISRRVGHSNLTTTLNTYVRNTPSTQDNLLAAFCEA